MKKRLIPLKEVNPDETEEAKTPSKAVPPAGQNRRHRPGDATDQSAGCRDGVGEGEGECED